MTPTLVVREEIFFGPILIILWPEAQERLFSALMLLLLLLQPCEGPRVLFARMSNKIRIQLD